MPRAKSFRGFRYARPTAIFGRPHPRSASADSFQVSGEKAQSVSGSCEEIGSVENLIEEQLFH